MLFNSTVGLCYHRSWSVMRHSLLVMSIVSPQLVAAIIGHCCIPLMAATVASAPVEHCAAGEPDASDEPDREMPAGHCCLLKAEAVRVYATLPAPEMLGTISREAAESTLLPGRHLSGSPERDPPPQENLLGRICILLI